MCGLVGEFRFDGTQPVLKNVLSAMTALERRGPDSGGHWLEGPLAFGHRRLSVIDLSDQANQPMVDEKLGLALVFNGAIYNYRELRAQLIDLGYEFFSHGDTEVILKAYAHWGLGCVERLTGMFAFALWDRKQQSVFLARDRFGIKPMYYALDDKRIRFASNVQALLKMGDIDTSIDTQALHNQFTLHGVVPAPRTIFKGVRKLPPAHTMMISSNGKTWIQKYWRLKATRPVEKKSEQEWREAIHGALMAAVKKRIEVADVPVGVLLSGGLDSSLLVALLMEAGVKDLRTFSIGFEDIGQEQGSEFEFSDQVVARYNTRHEKIYIPNSQVLTRLPEAVDAMSEPMFGQDAVAFYLLSEQVSKQVKVVQSGQGADEVFGGYFWYPRMDKAQGSELDRFASNYFDRDHEEYARMITSEYMSGDYTSELVQSWFDEKDADEFMDKVFRADVCNLIVDDPVKRVDNMTMAWGLEARVPFLDHELVELAAQMPKEYKLGSEGKHILKEISRPLLPAGVIDRPKGYFPMPALKYVRGEFLDFMRDILNSQACKERGLYNRDYVDLLLKEPEQHHTRIQGSKLWHMALLEFWLQRQL